LNFDLNKSKNNVLLSSYVLSNVLFG